jgi:PAS domain S-box-containing protein
LETTRVLLIDDDPDDFLLTSDYLNDIPNRKFDITWSGSYNDALQKLKSRSHDIYIVDFLLGAKTGLDLLHASAELDFQEPFIILTGKGDQKVDEEAMKLGAVDYLIKGELNAEVLERSIRYALDRANTLKALRESEKKYRTIFERSQDIIFLISPSGRVIEINRSVEEMLGYTPENIIANSMTGFWNEEEWQFFSVELEKKGFISNWESILTTKSGEKRYCLISAIVHNSSQNGKLYQVIAHDITARKKSEQESMRAEKLAATGRLSRTLAHEIRNPLTNINLSLEELESEIKDENLRFYLSIVRRNSERINDLINELLNSSRPSEISLEPQSLHEVLDETLELAIDRIRLKNIQLVKSYSQQNGHLIDLDRKKIQIAFLNIIINAVEAMEENKGVLKIVTDFTNNNCRVVIEDNGAGISRENMNKLFEPYFTSKTTGMGLGLAATLNIIQSHKANIEVESEIGVGTKFITTFQYN